MGKYLRVKVVECNVGTASDFTHANTVERIERVVRLQREKKKEKEH